MRIFLMIIFLAPFLCFGQTKHVRQLVDSGISAWQQGDYDQAIQQLTEALDQNPVLPDAYLYRAYALQETNEAHGALQDFLIYLRYHPENTEVLLATSVLQYELGQYEAAQYGFRTLLTRPAGETNTVFFKRPVYGEGVTSMMSVQSGNKAYLYSYLGLCAHGLGDEGRARLLLDSAISLAPGNPDYYVNRGNVYLSAGRPDLAENDFQQALRLDPTHSMARYNLAGVVQASGDDEKAVAYYSQNILDNPSSPLAYRQRGYRYLVNGQHDLALADFNRAIQLDPSDAETFINRGITFETMRAYELALADFARAIDLKPDLPKAYFNRGNTLFRMKQFPDALNDYSVALIYHPDYGQALYQRGLTHYYLENAEKACKDLTRAEDLGVSQATVALKIICTGINVSSGG